MKRRQMIMGAGLALALGLSAGQAMAADPVAAIARSLEREGFRVTSTRRTLLGRVRITATRHGQSREVVIDPRTGEVLRDLVREAVERGDSSAGSSGGSGSGSGSGSDDGGSDDSGSDDSGSDGSGSDDSGSDSSGSDDSGDGSDHGED